MPYISLIPGGESRMGLRELERKVDKLTDAVERLAHPTGGRRAEMRERWASRLAQMSDEELEDLEKRARKVLEDPVSREKLR